MQSIKCVVVGDSAVGKTSLIISYTNNTFAEDSVPTVFDTHTVDLDVEGVDAKLMSVWDTAGHETYDRLRPLSYPATDIFIICFSVVDPTSYENVTHKWQKEVFHHCPFVPIVLVGTKVDLRDDIEALESLQTLNAESISQDKGEGLAKKIGAAKYLECSARTHNGIKIVFDEVATLASGRSAVMRRKQSVSSTNRLVLKGNCSIL